MRGRSDVPEDAPSGNLLLENELYRRQLDGNVFRILYVDRRSDVCVLFNTSSTSALPEPRSYCEVLDDLAMRKLAPVAPHANTATPFSMLSGARRKFAEARLAKIQSLLDLGPALFDATERGRAISELNARRVCSPATAYKLLRLYWSGGMTIAALVTRHDKCGAAGRPRKDYSSKPGPRRTVRPGVGVVVTNANKALMQAAMTPERGESRLTVQQGYARYLARNHHDHAEVGADGAVTPRLGSENRVPNLDQFRYHVLDGPNAQLQRMGQRVRRSARRAPEERYYFDSARRSALLPGSRFELDATVLDVYLVSRFDRNRIVGRPTLYLVVDVLTGMIVGFSLSLYPPSWTSAIAALVNCLEDKVAQCEALGFVTPAWVWAPPVMSAQVLSDQGDMSSAPSGALAHATQAALLNARAYNPEGKGTVEGTFKCVQAPWGEFVEGYVPKQYEPRTDPDYRLDAAFNLREATALVASSAALRNITARARRPVDPDLLALDAAAVPAELWHRAAEEMGCAGRRFEPEAVRLQLLPRKNVTVTRRGLHLGRGLYYMSPALYQEPWFQDALVKKLPVPVIWNPEVSSHIHVPNPFNSNEVHVANLAPHSSKFEDRSFVEIDCLRREQRKLNAEANQRNTFQIAQLHDFQHELVDQALQSKREHHDAGRSKARRVSDIRENRRLELSTATLEAALTESLSTANEVAASDAGPSDLAKRAARRRQQFAIE